MKKITYFLLAFLLISSCKYDENPYAFTREFDGGTFITPDGKVKYISGTPDSLIIVTDNYAVIQENITYVKKYDNGMLKDSILIYGHVYSKNPNPVVCGYDSVSKIDLLERLKQNSSYHFKGTEAPESFLTGEDLFAGKEFQSSLGLHYEETYYVRSFVVTGRFVGGLPEYKDIAYNQKDLEINTKSPVDLWVGGGMTDTPAAFDDNYYWGATSFSYNGYMFILQGHDEAPMSNQIELYRYDPVSNSWDNPYKNFTVGDQVNFTNAVCFVLEDIKLENNQESDYLFLGLGITNDGDAGNVNFYRLDLTDGLDKPLGEWGTWEIITDGTSEADFPGTITENSIAFSLNGIGYVALGTTDYSNEPVEYVYKYDPTEKSLNHDRGTWTKIGNFPGGKRTEAVCFTLGSNVYVACGRDEAGVYKNDLWMCRQTTGDYLSWTQRTPFPGEARVEAVGFALGEMGYVGLGKNSSAEALSDFYRYNPFTNQWEQRADFGKIDGVQVGKPRYEAVGVGIKISDNDYRAYVGSGWAGVPELDFNDFWHYRP